MPNLLGSPSGRIELYKRLEAGEFTEAELCQTYNGTAVSSCGELFYKAMKDGLDNIYHIMFKNSINYPEWGKFHKSTYTFGKFTDNYFLRQIGFKKK